MAGLFVKVISGIPDRKHRLQRLIATPSLLEAACSHHTSVVPPPCLELSTGKASMLFEMPASPNPECRAVRL